MFEARAVAFADVRGARSAHGIGGDAVPRPELITEPEGRLADIVNVFPPLASIGSTLERISRWIAVRGIPCGASQYGNWAEQGESCRIVNHFQRSCLSAIGGKSDFNFHTHRDLLLHRNELSFFGWNLSAAGTVDLDQGRGRLCRARHEPPDEQPPPADVSPRKVGQEIRKLQRRR